MATTRRRPLGIRTGRQIIPPARVPGPRSWRGTNGMAGRLAGNRIPFRPYMPDVTHQPTPAAPASPASTPCGPHVRADRLLGAHFLLAILLLAILGGCARVGPPLPNVGPAPPVGSGWTETGIASWYGNPYHGRTTASGEIYDMEAMTAAHRTLPFHTIVLVENLRNGRSTTLRINDRGPFVRGRTVDVSRRAARELDLIGPGTAPVRLTVLDSPAAAGSWQGNPSQR